jgi:hypothetical protein
LDGDAASSEGLSREEEEERRKLKQEFEKQCEKRKSKPRRSSFEQLKSSGSRGTRELRKSLLREAFIEEGGDPSKIAAIRKYEQLGLDDSATEVECYVTHGLFIDFLIRMSPVNRPKAGEGSSHPHDYLSSVLRADTKEKAVHSMGYSAAIEAVNREMLYSGILETITKFQKERSNPAWTVPTHVLLERATHVKKIKKEVVCYKAEVNNWMLRYTLLRAEPKAVETQSERHERRQQFWAQFHEGSRKVEVSKGKVYRGKDSQERAALEPLKHDSEKGLEVKQRSCHDLHWKNRAARSRCTAGAWDWSRSTNRETKRGSSTGSMRRTSTGDAQRGSSAALNRRTSSAPEQYDICHNRRTSKSGGHDAQ